MCVARKAVSRSVPGRDNLKIGAFLDVDYYVCEGVANGVARGTTHPVPKCFKDETDATLAKQKKQQEDK